MKKLPETPRTETPASSPAKRGGARPATAKVAVDSGPTATKVAVDRAMTERMAVLEAGLKNSAEAIEKLQVLLASARDELADLRRDRDGWRDQARELQARNETLDHRNGALIAIDAEHRRRIATLEGYVAALKGEAVPGEPPALRSSVLDGRHDGRASMRGTLRRWAEARDAEGINTDPGSQSGAGASRAT